MMITEEKIKAIRNELKRGVPQGELCNRLLEEGYSEEDLNRVFLPHQYDMRSWYLTFGIIFLVLGVVIFLQYGSYLLVIGSAILFSLYYTESKKLRT